jgi:phosphonate transport system ATP-binding protein
MIRIENVSKTYDGVNWAVHELSLTLEAGEFVVVLGKSGSGKSTLIRLLNRLVEPSAGRIFLGGDEITGASPARLRRLRRRMGMIFQEYNLVPRLPVLTNALTGALGEISPAASLFNHFPAAAAKRARGHIKRLGLGDRIYQRADRLSGGQKQRVGIARALMQEPEVLLADEPVSSLDPSTSRVILDILQGVHRDRGVTVICNLHLPALARDYGTRVLGLRKGRLVFDGPPENLDDSAVHNVYDED